LDDGFTNFNFLANLNKRLIDYDVILVGAVAAVKIFNHGLSAYDLKLAMSSTAFLVFHCEITFA
jgi:hypothetical protein